MEEKEEKKVEKGENKKRAGRSKRHNVHYEDRHRQFNFLNIPRVRPLVLVVKEG
jgi:hypothetical protein